MQTHNYAINPARFTHWTHTRTRVFAGYRNVMFMKKQLHLVLLIFLACFSQATISQENHANLGKSEKEQILHIFQAYNDYESAQNAFFQVFPKGSSTSEVVEKLNTFGFGCRTLQNDEPIKKGDRISIGTLPKGTTQCFIRINREGICEDRIWGIWFPDKSENNVQEVFFTEFHSCR